LGEGKNVPSGWKAGPFSWFLVPQIGMNNCAEERKKEWLRI
jgi:hypothetical protein